jgi:predicted ATPase
VPVLTTLAVEGYRSLRRLVVPLRQLNVVVGANGTGKSSLYRAIRLLAEAAHNGAVSALAREGGLPSSLWAGLELLGRSVRDGAHPVQGTVRSKPVGQRLGFATAEFGYAIDLGLPQQSKSPLRLDPEIKAEATWSGGLLRPATVLTERRGGLIRARSADGSWYPVPYQIQPFDTMLSAYADVEHALELIALREQLRSWRFYDQFRTDSSAPARQTHIGTRTPVLDHDGSDLAAALLTIIEMGVAGELDEAVDNAFTRSRLSITNDAGQCRLSVSQPGLLRPLGVEELSDGTLRYLLWIAALLTPRPPSLLVLNEPEPSLHPDLLPALAQLIVAASQRAQIAAVSHSALLVDALEEGASKAGVDAQTLELTKDFGETVVAGRDRLDAPSWEWPHR